MLYRQTMHLLNLSIKKMEKLNKKDGTKNRYQIIIHSP